MGSSTAQARVLGGWPSDFLSKESESGYKERSQRKGKLISNSTSWSTAVCLFVFISPFFFYSHHHHNFLRIIWGKYCLRIIYCFSKMYIIEFMFRIYNGESPVCDFPFPTNEQIEWEEALPLVLSITPTSHYIGLCVCALGVECVCPLAGKGLLNRHWIEADCV